MSLRIQPEPVPLAMDDGGVVRMSGTRVTLDTLVASFEEGATPEAIAQRYPTVPLGVVYATLTCYLRHRDEVEEYLEERREEIERVRRSDEERSGVADLRRRLEGRRPVET